LPSGDNYWRILQDGMAERHQRLAAIVGTLVATGSDSLSES
jgi:hypothetical protein